LSCCRIRIHVRVVDDQIKTLTERLSWQLLDYPTCEPVLDIEALKLLL
jgi:hypothetical protein